MEKEIASKHKRVFVNEEIFKNKATNSQVHRDFPLCDPEKGRSQLSWLKCYHLGCGRIFSCGTGLVQHLTVQGVYMEGHIVNHELAYAYGINIQQIDKTCKVCKVEFKSRQELIDHLARLGIQGYWKKGMTYQKEVLQIRSKGQNELQLLYGKKGAQEYKFQHTTLQNIFQTQLCLVCQQFPSNVIYEKCKHFNVCYRCYKMLQQKSICIYCKTASQPLFAVKIPDISSQVEKLQYKQQVQKQFLQMVQKV